MSIFQKVELGSAHLLKLQSEYVWVTEPLQQGATRKEEMKPWGQPQLRVALTAVWQQGSEAFLVTQLCQSKAVSALCISLIRSEITLPIIQILALLSSLTLLSHSHRPTLALLSCLLLCGSCSSFLPYFFKLWVSACFKYFWSHFLGLALL